MLKKRNIVLGKLCICLRVSEYVLKRELGDCGFNTYHDHQRLFSRFFWSIYSAAKVFIAFPELNAHIDRSVRPYLMRADAFCFSSCSRSKYKTSLWYLRSVMYKLQLLYFQASHNSSTHDISIMRAILSSTLKE